MYPVYWVPHQVDNPNVKLAWGVTHVTKTHTL